MIWQIGMSLLTDRKITGFLDWDEAFLEIPFAISQLIQCSTMTLDLTIWFMDTKHYPNYLPILKKFHLYKLRYIISKNDPEDEKIRMGQK